MDEEQNASTREETLMVPVPLPALQEVLLALVQPVSSPRIRELMATRDVAKLTGESNPINVLVDTFNNWVEKYNEQNQKSDQKPG